MREDDELWWNADEMEAHEPLFEHISSEHEGFIKANQSMIWEHYRLYDRMEAQALQNQFDDSRSDRPKLGLNIVRAVVNAVHSKIIQSKPRPTFLTIGQGAKARNKAKRTQAYVDGCNYHADTYDIGAEVLLNALILGSGCAAVYRDADGRPAVENVFLAEMRRDNGAYRQRNPRNEYRVRAVDRQGLIDEYCNSDDEAENERIRALIHGSGRASKDLRVYGDDDCDQVTVIDAYRRPSTKDAGDGRHILAIEGGTIIDEEWKTKPPFVWAHWQQRPQGFLGMGIAEQLKSLQTEINLILLRMQEQMVYGGPRVLLERGSAINPDELQAEIYGTIEYSGQPPQIVQFPYLSPENIQILELLYQKAFDDVGVSQLAARSEKPAGLNSGRALLTFSDLESAKFVAFGQEYERWVRDVSEQFLWLAINDDDMDDEQKKRPVYAATKKYRQRYLEPVTKADIVSSLDETRCQVFPTSALAQSPSAKLDQVGEMSDRGWLQKEEAVSLLDFPDLENAGALMSSPVEYLDMCCDRMLEDGEPLSPEPWIMGAEAKLRVSQHLQLAQLRGDPEERWQLLANYLNAITRREDQDAAKKAAAAAPPPGAAPPGAPPMPMPMPGAPPAA